MGKICLSDHFKQHLHTHLFTLHCCWSFVAIAMVQHQGSNTLHKNPLSRSRRVKALLLCTIGRICWFINTKYPQIPVAPYQNTRNESSTLPRCLILFSFSFRFCCSVQCLEGPISDMGEPIDMMEWARAVSTVSYRCLLLFLRDRPIDFPLMTYLRLLCCATHLPRAAPCLPLTRPKFWVVRPEWGGRNSDFYIYSCEIPCFDIGVPRKAT